MIYPASLLCNPVSVPGMAIPEGAQFTIFCIPTSVCSGYETLYTKLNSYKWNDKLSNFPNDGTTVEKESTQRWLLYARTVGSCLFNYICNNATQPESMITEIALFLFQFLHALLIVYPDHIFGNFGAIFSEAFQLSSQRKHKDYLVWRENQLPKGKRSLSFIIPINRHRRLRIHPKGCEEQIITINVGQCFLFDSSLLHCGDANLLDENSICVHGYFTTNKNFIPNNKVFFD